MIITWISRENERQIKEIKRIRTKLMKSNEWNGSIRIGQLVSKRIVWNDGRQMNVYRGGESKRMKTNELGQTNYLAGYRICQYRWKESGCQVHHDHTSDEGYSQPPIDKNRNERHLIANRIANYQLVIIIWNYNDSKWDFCLDRLRWR